MKEREMRCVGGPLDGTVLRTTANVVKVDGYPGMAYHRSRPTDTDWRSRIDYDWWIRNLPEPVIPDHVLEWHGEDWLSPEVAFVRRALSEAMA